MSFFSTPNPERNFSLIVEDKKLWISKEVLASYSSVFQRMFFGDFKEADDDSVKLPGKRSKDVIEFLQCLIPCPIRKSVDKTNLELMARFADEYEVKDLKHRCESVLKAILQRISSAPEKNITEFFNHFNIAVSYRYKDLVKTYIPYAASFPLKTINGFREIYPVHVSLALYEAQLNRRVNENHDSDKKRNSAVVLCSTCFDASHHFFCSKCVAMVCPKKFSECKKYHKNGCKFKNGFPYGGDCLCGYTFDHSFLDKRF